MATHSSIRTLEIPWTEEPGGLYTPWDWKRVRHDLATINNDNMLYMNVVENNYWVIITREFLKICFIL